MNAIAEVGLTSVLRVTEIFFSLQGEANSVGWPTVFIRLTGCPLRCQYCDTAYAFSGGTKWKITDILQQVQQYHTRYVTVTGGEPLAQPECLVLLRELCNWGYHVSLETGGSLDVSLVDARVIKVVDIKTPGSGEVNQNNWGNLSILCAQDQVKIVICNRQDYEWAKRIIAEYRLSERCTVLFSPSYLQQDASELAEWILSDQLNVRFQIQLHKILWGEVPGK